MGKKTIHVSDFTGTVLQQDDEVVRVVVLEHPDLVAGPVQLDATPGEVENIDDAALDVAVVEIQAGTVAASPPGGVDRQRVRRDGHRRADGAAVEDGRASSPAQGP